MRSQCSVGMESLPIYFDDTERSRVHSLGILTARTRLWIELALILTARYFDPRGFRPAKQPVSLLDIAALAGFTLLRLGRTAKPSESAR